MYNPRQLRGPDGRWISTGVKKSTRAARSAANKKAFAGKKASPKKRVVSIQTASSRQGRGVGLTGLKQNTIPHLRISKRSTTVGVNSGTFIPGTNKRIVIGNYARIEHVGKTKYDQRKESLLAKAMPKGSKRDLLGKHVKKHVKLDNPAIRYSTPGTSSRHGVQARLGTSRHAGPTLIVRRGKHKTSQPSSKSGVKNYNKRMDQIAGRKVSKPRPERRKSAKRRK